ncbi:unnamed protein product, partial [Adineta ricciae]
QLRFRQANDEEHPDIEFLFAQGYHEDGYQFDGKAHAFYPEEHLGGDVHYDEDEDWSAYRELEYGLMDLFSVTVHELGHSLGLMHSNIPDAIMFPYYRGYSNNIKLHNDDIAAIRRLYGDPPSGIVTPEPDQISKESHDYTVTAETSTISEIEMTVTTLPPTTTTTATIPTTTTLKTTISMSPVTTLTSLHVSFIPTTTTTTTTIVQYPTTPVTPSEAEASKQQSQINSIDRSKLDLCDGYYDALTMYKGVLFIFKGQYFWQYDRRGLDPLSPMINNAFWLGLPENLSKIDAAYERADGRLMLFSGRQYWIFEDNKISIESNGFSYPRNLTSLGLPTHVDHIDAAFLWSFNRQAYLVSANLYWALDERWNRVNTYDYPRDMTMWQGIDVPLDDAFVDISGSTYFFKGLEFWRLNDTSMESAIDYPRSINTEWLYCDKPRSSSNRSIQTTWTCFFSLLFALSISYIL